MIGDKYIVTKDFEKVKKGNILTVEKIYYGVEELRFNGIRVCDVGSWYEKNRCKPYKETLKSIHIYSDGTITTAILKEGKQVVKKAIAECSINDTFDFKTGVDLAFSRLFEDDRKVEKKQSFIPYLMKFDNSKIGNIGEETTWTDIVGRKLYIGDTVSIFNNGVESKAGESVVIFDKNNYQIMGLYDYDFINGFFKNWKIVKKRSFKDVNDKESIRGIKYIKSKTCTYN
jgi:hypothetical protein